MSSSTLGETIVTGGAGFLGAAVCRKLESIGIKPAVPRSAHYDLTDPTAASALIRSVKPTTIIHLAAEVGGIGANQQNPGRYIYANLAMGMNVIEQARRHGAGKVVFVGTVCSYPRIAPLPFCESSLWDGYPEETNAPYGIAKKAVGEMLMAYHRQYGMAGAYVIPTNLYGPGDNFDLETGHVIPAIIRRVCEADGKPVKLWGTGSATRQFLHVDDAAAAIVTAAQAVGDPRPINVGADAEISIRELAEMIATIVGHEGGFVWDDTKPDGQPRRAVSSSRASDLLGWSPRVRLADGLRQTVQWWMDSSSRSV